MISKGTSVEKLEKQADLYRSGRNFQVSKSCSRQQHLLSVSRGVRSRPPEEGIESQKVETFPLLSPTMETQLLKESWVFPSPVQSSPKDEDTTVLSAWEENFQDLSGWCMDTFQDQCDFHTGESTALKLSGTKYEGNDVLTSEEGLLKDIAGATDDEKWSSKMDNTESHEHPDNCNATTVVLLPTIEGIKEERGTADCSMSDSWSKLPEDATSFTWNKQNGTNGSATIHPGYRIDDLDLDDACPTPPFNSTESQHETWDVLHTVETTGSDTFDLLSYLCDDEMRSAGGSTSTASIPTLPRQRSTKSKVATLSSLKAKTEKKSVESTRRKIEPSSTCTVTSASSTVVPTRRSGRTRTASVKYLESTSPERTERTERYSRKRHLEDDDDLDDCSSVSSYRESREKNNEASRKSRMNKKAKENEMTLKAVELERDNRILKMKVEELEKLVTSMRNALLRSALRKEF